jgi:hypothetical protein
MGHRGRKLIPFIHTSYRGYMREAVISRHEERWQKEPDRTSADNHNVDAVDGRCPALRMLAWLWRYYVGDVILCGVGLGAQSLTRILSRGRRMVCTASAMLMMRSSRTYQTRADHVNRVEKHVKLAFSGALATHFHTQRTCFWHFDRAN